jgi:hypothetical protein
MHCSTAIYVLQCIGRLSKHCLATCSGFPEVLNVLKFPVDYIDIHFVATMCLANSRLCLRIFPEFVCLSSCFTALQHCKAICAIHDYDDKGVKIKALVAALPECFLNESHKTSVLTLY